MDAKLIGWARAVKARHSGKPPVPPLWLFTDQRRLADPCGTARRLPRGLAGVVLRHDDDPQRVAIGCELARICRLRRLRLVVAGDVRLAVALKAGVHLRGGRWPGVLRRCGLLTSSAHSRPELLRARRMGATLAFLSPVFATASHPDARALGPIRFAGLASGAGLAVFALGGITGDVIRRLPSACRGVGAIGALGD